MELGIKFKSLFRKIIHFWENLKNSQYFLNKILTEHPISLWSSILFSAIII